MADDVRQLLDDAAPRSPSPPDFDGMWRHARRQRWLSQTGGGHREPQPEISVTWERLDDPRRPP